VALGSHTTSSTTTILGGSNGVNINVGTYDDPTNINTGLNTGTVTIGGTGAMTIAIGDGGTGAKIVSLGDSVGASSLTLNAGTGDIDIDSADALTVDTVGIMGVTVGGTYTLTATGEYLLDTTVGMTIDSAQEAADAISITASGTAGGITLNAGSAGITCSDDSIANIGDISCDDIVDDTDDDIMYMLKTIVQTIDLDDDASTDDFTFDDDAADSTAQNVDLGELIPAFAEVVSVHLRCFESVGAGTFQVTLGITSAANDLLAQTTIDGAGEADGTATGAGPKLETSASARHIWVQGDPSGNWSDAGDAGRWTVMVSYIDYGAAHTQNNP